MDTELVIKLARELEQTCFCLAQKRDELEKIKVNIFTLNPEIPKLIEEIGELESKKKNLEEQIDAV